MITKLERRIKIKYRVRNKISGTTERPRMSVFRSNKQIYVQIINDTTGTTWHRFHTQRISRYQSSSGRIVNYLNIDLLVTSKH